MSTPAKNCARRLLALLTAFTSALMINSPSGNSAVARDISQPVNMACRYAGTLIVPQVDKNHPYGWGFVVNFDHSGSQTAVTTCLATRNYPQEPWQTTYTVAEHCTVLNNTAGVVFGNGTAPFDGNAKLSCIVPVPATIPTLFWTRVNVRLPAASQRYTLLKSVGLSAGITLTAQTDPTCEQIATTSVYPGFQFTNSAAASCGGFVDLGSRVTRSGINSREGYHRIGANLYGPTTGSGFLQIPANFRFEIDAAGQPYTLDWFVIDPTPTKCCSPQ
jgi:hypothetical protein